MTLRTYLPCLALTVLSTAVAADPIHLRGETMGTTYRVELPNPPPAVTAERLLDSIEWLLAEIDRELSTYRPDSEISLFNTSTSTQWTNVSPGTYRAVAAALDVSRLSAGAFDITVGPLVDVWGFGAVKTEHRQRPPHESIRAAVGQMGYHHIAARARPPALRKHNAAIRLDLSGVGNGYGVDRIAERLDALGTEDYLVEIGGELRARGRNGKGRSWRAAIEEPGGRGDAAISVVHLDGLSVATSATQRNYFDDDGTRYSHIIDPRTGLPIAHALISVSVIDASALRADALATALLVLGPEDGPRLARQHDVAALFVVRGDGILRQIRTSAFTRWEVS